MRAFVIAMENEAAVVRPFLKDGDRLYVSGVGKVNAAAATQKAIDAGADEILNCGVEESALTDGKPDADKMKPICFDTCQHVYRLMGEVVAQAFSCGKELM